MAGEGWTQSGGAWVGRVPDLILSDGALDACPGCGALEMVGAWPLTHPDWSADLRQYRTAP